MIRVDLSPVSSSFYSDPFLFSPQENVTHSLDQLNNNKKREPTSSPRPRPKEPSRDQSIQLVNLPPPLLCDHQLWVPEITPAMPKLQPSWDYFHHSTVAPLKSLLVSSIFTENNGNFGILSYRAYVWQGLASLNARLRYAEQNFP